MAHVETNIVVLIMVKFNICVFVSCISTSIRVHAVSPLLCDGDDADETT